jgi:hypothetical protein
VQVLEDIPVIYPSLVSLGDDVFALSTDFAPHFWTDILGASLPAPWVQSCMCGICPIARLGPVAP